MSKNMTQEVKRRRRNPTTLRLHCTYMNILNLPNKNSVLCSIGHLGKFLHRWKEIH